MFRWTFLRLSSVCCCFCFIVRDVLLLFSCSNFLYRTAWYHSVVVNSSVAFFVYTQNTFTCNVLSPFGLEVEEVTILYGSQVPVKLHIQSPQTTIQWREPLESGIGNLPMEGSLLQGTELTIFRCNAVRCRIRNEHLSNAMQSSSLYEFWDLTSRMQSAHKVRDEHITGRM